MADTYTTGTITVSAGGSPIVGTGTLWSAVVYRGDMLVQNGSGIFCLVDTVTDDTHIIPFGAHWPGGSISGAAYTIYKNSPLRFANASAMQVVLDSWEMLQQTGVVYGVVGTGILPDVSIGSNGQYAINLDEAPWKFWKKVAGVWVLQPQFPGYGTFSASITPLANDGAALGTTSLKWSDLFLASGGVINFNSGNMTITHAANLLAVGGGNFLIGGALGTPDPLNVGISNAGGIGGRITVNNPAADTVNNAAEFAFKVGTAFGTDFYTARIRSIITNVGTLANDFIINLYDGTAPHGGVQKFQISSSGNVVPGALAALATSATDGFLYVPTCAGTPTGTPTAYTGKVPNVYDTTNNKRYTYNGGAWKGGGPFGFYAHKNGTDQTGLIHGAYTKITFGTERFDVGGFYDTTNSRWTPPAGLVQLNAHIWCSQNAASTSTPTFVAKIIKNGSADVGAGVGTAQVGAPGLAFANVSCVDNASGTDFYEVQFFFTSSTAANNGNIDGNAAHTHFSGATFSAMG